MGTSFKYLIALVIGLIITPYAMKAAYIQRGYFALGGELLVPVLIISLVAAWNELSSLESANDNRRHKKSTHRSAQNKFISLN